MAAPAADLVGRTLTLTREVAAPRDLVWRVWTEPAHLTKWFAPHPFTIPVCHLDVRTGGSMNFDMQAPDGAVHHCLGTYDEVRRPEKLVFTAGVPGPDGSLLFNNRNTVTFHEKGGKTTVKVHIEVIQAVAAAAPFIAGMEIGWNMTLNQCLAYAERQKKPA